MESICIVCRTDDTIHASGTSYPEMRGQRELTIVAVCKFAYIRITPIENERLFINLNFFFFFFFFFNQ